MVMPIPTVFFPNARFPPHSGNETPCIYTDEMQHLKRAKDILRLPNVILNLVFESKETVNTHKAFQSS